LGFIRIVIALIAIIFFLYFFAVEVNNIIYLKTLSNVNFIQNEELELLMTELDDLRFAILLMLMDPTNQHLEDDYNEQYEKIQPDIETVLEWVDENSHANLYYLMTQHSMVIEGLVGHNNITIVQYYGYFFDLILELSDLWSEICYTTNIEFNRFAKADISVSSYCAFYQLRRDIIITSTNFTLTSSQLDFLRNLYYKCRANEDYFYMSLLRYYNPQQKNALEDYFATESTQEVAQNITVLEEKFEELVLTNLTLNLEISDYIEDIQIMLDGFGTVDDYETLDHSPIFVKFAVALIGVIFEFGTAISLIWLAIPVAKLLWKFHSEEKSSSNKSKHSTIQSKSEDRD